MFILHIEAPLPYTCEPKVNNKVEIWSEPGKSKIVWGL